MDLRFVIRQGVRYGFARVGLWIARAVLVAAAIYMFRGRGRREMAAVTRTRLRSSRSGPARIAQENGGRSLELIDRQFFREAYDANTSSPIWRLKQAAISRYRLCSKGFSEDLEHLHVPDIVILIREGEHFVPRYSTRTGEPMSIPVDSRIAQELREKQEALTVYFDKAPAWIVSLNAEELQTLDFMRTQLLLPIFGSGRLAGILSLGSKLSEIPYSARTFACCRRSHRKWRWHSKTPGWHRHWPPRPRTGNAPSRT